MSCCGGGPGVSSGHHHGAAAGPAAGAADTAASAFAPKATADKSGFANTKCPIMGGAIDPAKVPESLTRVYKGQKVAFCCGMCPAKWDKLTDAEKDAKFQ